MQHHVHQTEAVNYLQLWQLICIVGKRKMVKMNSLYSQNKEKEKPGGDWVTKSQIRWSLHHLHNCLIFLYVWEQSKSLWAFIFLISILVTNETFQTSSAIIIIYCKAILWIGFLCFRSVQCLCPILHNCTDRGQQTFLSGTTSLQPSSHYKRLSLPPHPLLTDKFSQGHVDAFMWV